MNETTIHGNITATPELSPGTSRSQALVEQVPSIDLDNMGIEMESVAYFGLVMLANVEDYLAGTYVEPPIPSRRRRPVRPASDVTRVDLQSSSEGLHVGRPVQTQPARVDPRHLPL